MFRSLPRGRNRAVLWVAHAAPADEGGIGGHSDGWFAAGRSGAVGMMLGVVLLVLGATGAIGRFARLIPQSVSTGLQLGLGLLMGVLGIRLILETPEDRLRLPCPSRPADARPILSGSTNHARSGCGRGVAQQQRGLAARDFPGMERAAARHSEMAGSIAQF